MRDMNYQYSGYLSTILYKPDADVRDSLEAIDFSGEALVKWKTQDLEHAKEWQEIPVKKKTTDLGVSIEGDFRGVTTIDNLSEDDPRYWVPLTSVGLKDGGFPVDVSKYPIIEVTYRCTSERAHPTWMWTYEGGSHFGALPHSREWITVARNVQHFGFPKLVQDVVLRLYSPTRSVESMEVASVRFREMSDTEGEAFRKSLVELEEERPKERFPVLDEFMPCGVYMDAESAKRLAGMLGISHEEYWGFVMEDMVWHYHNAIALAHADHLTPDEWKLLLDLGEKHGIKFIPRHEFPIGGAEEEQRRVIETHIKPYADSKSIFARMMSGEPIESNFQDVLGAKRLIEEGDPNHPVALVARYPNAYPLYASFFQASGIGHFASRRPWDVGKMVRAHVRLTDAQQFWVAGPAFVYPMNTPEWSTCPEMRLMCNLALANGARGWLSYSYHNDPVWLRGRINRTLTGPFLMFSDLWMELMQRMKLASAIAPLLLKASPEESIEDWFSNSFTADRKIEPIAGGPPISHFHLRGADFSLYFTVSNNTHDMVGVDMSIPRDAVSGEEMYDLTQYVQTREWLVMERNAHHEMFPGQSQIILVGKKDVCEQWRDVIAERIVSNDLMALRLLLQLARAYDLPSGGIEDRALGGNGASTLEQLTAVHKAKDDLNDLIYGAKAISETRSQIIAASSAICASDGALCRLMRSGKTDLAHDLGQDLIPLAREVTGLRLDMRQGRGAQILKSSCDLTQRSLALLQKARGG